MASDALALEHAFVRYGPSVAHIARQYTNPINGKPLSGAALLAKLVQGESGGKRNQVSSAGARGFAQFMPGSRAVAITKYGVDPWRSPAEAVRAATLHLRGLINGSTGLRGYNPGDPNYPAYILGQKVGAPSGGAARSRPLSRAIQPGSPVATFDAPQPVTQPAAPSRPPVRSAGLRTPGFAASAVVPVGYQPVESGGGPVAQPPLAPVEDVAAPSLASTLVGDSQAKAVGAPRARAAGRVAVAAGADRAGVSTQPVVTAFLGDVSASARGRKIVVTTGSNHNELTVNGRVSDHWDGRAADVAVPTDSQAGDLLAAHALQVAGVPFKRALVLARKGGLFNVTPKDGPYKGRRVQVIWRYPGHHSHLHVGIR